MPTPTKTAEKEQRRTQPKESKPASDQHPTGDASPPSNQSGSIPAFRGQKPSTNNGEKKATTDWWPIINSVLTTIFTGVLAFLAYRQWRAMESQAKYMREGLTVAQQSAGAALYSSEIAMRSIKLQESHMQQWVDLLDWSSELADAKSPTLWIRVKLVNRTAFPLTLKNASLKFINVSVGSGGFSLIENFFLAPNCPLRINASIPITEAQMSSYQEDIGVVVMNVERQLVFFAVLGTASIQPIRGIVNCRCPIKLSLLLKPHLCIPRSNPQIKSKPAIPNVTYRASLSRRNQFRYFGIGESSKLLPKNLLGASVRLTKPEPRCYESQLRKMGAWAGLSLQADSVAHGCP